MSVEGFRERLPRLIAESGLSNEQIASTLGVGASAVQKWRDGIVATITLHNGLELSRILKVSPWYLACKFEPNNSPMPPESDSEAGSHSDSNLAPIVRSMNQDLKILAMEVARIRDIVESNTHRARRHASKSS